MPDPNYIDQIFGPSGLLAQKFVGYEQREAQVEIVRAIDDALMNEKNLLVEAPCGSGKGISYLVPTIRHSFESGASRVLVVTANIALSEQLVKKDLPALCDVLPWYFDFGMAKGRGNFLCKYAYDKVDRLLLRVLPSSRVQIDQIDEWAATTTTGDLSELPFEPNEGIKRRVTMTSDECMGRKCDRFDDCFVEAAKKRLETAKIVVTNYHLFFADQAIRRITGGESSVLPDVDIVVFDEIDNAADIARSFYGFELSLGRIEYLAKHLVASKKEGLPEVDQDLKIEIEEHAKRFFDELTTYAKSKAYKSRIRDANSVPYTELAISLVDAGRAYLFASKDESLDRPQRERLRKLSLKCQKTATELKQVMTLENENFAYFIRVDDRNRATLHGSPIDIADLLKHDVWNNEQYRSVIGTSATLTTDGNFDWIKGELGADDADELSVDSPFNICQNMLVVVPEGLPLPSDRNFQEEVAKVLCEAIEQARGRALGLFTSYKGLRAAATVVRQTLGNKYEILVQGDAPRMQLVDRFRSETSSVLLGTDSFWTGIDVQGESLSCLFIDKLPFPSPDDPILDVFASRDPKGHWMKNCLPKALIAFRQGVGRLLRTTTDRGVVVICDSRVVDKFYGRTFLEACGATRIRSEMSDIRSFLDDPEKWKRNKKKR